MEELIVIGFCLILNAFFSAFEMAFVSIPRSTLRSLLKKKKIQVETILFYRENPERTLSIIQVGITLVGAIAAAVGGIGAAENLEPYLVQRFKIGHHSAQFLALLFVVAPLTFLTVVMGELVPKTLALRNPLKIVFAGARILVLAEKLLGPLISILEGSTKIVIKLFFRQFRDRQIGEHILELDLFSPVHKRLMLNLAGIEKKKFLKFI